MKETRYEINIPVHWNFLSLLNPKSILHRPRSVQDCPFVGKSYIDLGLCRIVPLLENLYVNKRPGGGGGGG